MPKWLERLFRIEPGISLYQWAVDRITGNWDRLLNIAGASVMTYLGAITDWVRDWGPFGLGLAFLGALLLISLTRYVIEIGAVKARMRRDVDRALSAGRVNVLEPEFRHQRIAMLDFFNHFHIPNESKTFTNCELIGPANVAAIGCRFIGVQFSNCQFVLLKPDPGGGRLVKGVVAMKECSFLNCKFVGCTFFVLPEELAVLRQQMAGQLDVITFEDVGNRNEPQAGQGPRQAQAVRP